NAAEPNVSGFVFEHAIDGEAPQAILLSELLEGFVIISARATSLAAGKTAGMPKTEVSRPIDDHRAHKNIQQSFFGSERCQCLSLVTEGPLLAAEPKVP